MPLILFKYIAKKNITYFLVILLIVSIMMLIFDFMELVKISYNIDLSMSMIFKLATLRNYYHVEKTFPFIFILTTILTYANLTKSSELIVARSYGMSVWQFIFPAVTVAFVFGVINVLFLNPIGSSMLGKFERLEAIHLKGHSSTIAISKNGLWLKEAYKKGNTIIHAMRVSQETKELFEVTFFLADKNYKFLTRIYANSAKLEDGKSWLLSDVDISNADYSFEHKDTYLMPTKISFLQIQESVISPDTISIYNLPAFIKTTQESGFSTLRHLNYLFKIVVSPFFYLSMVLIGLVFATKSSRSGRVGIFMFLGIMVGFLIYFLSDIINAIGIAGNIPVIFSAIAPTLICFTIGLYLVLHYEDG
ncbi:LPS export ABC transporter permease LptG [Candidatus Jidaibacter acanthamoebae]|nr:LPS export ABC transporter permease LptG [Candidatus Jidaibacter acanthamoeba]